MRSMWATMLLPMIIVTSVASAQTWSIYADSARFFKEQKQTDKAIECFLKSEAVLPKDSLQSASHLLLLTNLAQLYRSQGVLDKAEIFYLEAREIMVKTTGKENAAYINNSNALTALYVTREEYKKAEAGFVEVRTLRVKVPGAKSPEYASACNNLATFYYTVGEFAKAEPLYLEAKELLEQLNGKESKAYANSCNYLASLYKEMGRFGKAEPLALEAKALRQKLLTTRNADYATSCITLANIYAAMGQYSRAEPLYLEAKVIREELFTKEDPLYAASCNILADLYTYTRNYKQAENLYLEARSIREAVFTKEHSLYAETCNNLSDLYIQMGDYEKAKPLAREAMTIWEKTKGKDHPDYAIGSNNLGQVYLFTGDFKKAKSLLLEARAIWRKRIDNDHPFYILNTRNLANAYWQGGNYSKADILYKEALAAQHRNLQRIFLFTSEVEKEKYIASTADLLRDYLSFRLAAPAVKDNGFLYDAVLQNRNLTLVSSRQLKHDVNNFTDTVVRNKYAEWIDIREELAYWYTTTAPYREQNKKTLEEKANTLEKELNRMVAEMRSLQQPELSWKSVQDQLRQGEAAVEYVAFDYYNGRQIKDSTFYIALVLTKQDPQPRFVPLFEERRLDSLMLKNRSPQHLTRLYSGDADSGDGTLLYSMVWQPLEKALRGAKKVYYAPAGDLYRLSFAALPTRGRHCLASRYYLIQLNTTASMAQPSTTLTVADGIRLYGGIQYDAESSAKPERAQAFTANDEATRSWSQNEFRGYRWDYLPGTEKEVQFIQSLGRHKGFSVEALYGAAALEESVKAISNAATPTVLHIATHGFSFPAPRTTLSGERMAVAGNSHAYRNSSNPLLRSGLLFAGSNRNWREGGVAGMEDGILTSYEVANLYLPQIKLVVLSACETALGDIQGSEGVYGLQRAFKMAGAGKLLMSLWKVPDTETAEFMGRFYQYLFNGAPISDAFRQTQQAFRAKYGEDPYKWAAWILIE